MTSPARDRAFSVNRPLTPKRRRIVVENDEYAAFVGRVIRAYSRRVAAGDVDAIADMIQTAADLMQLFIRPSLACAALATAGPKSACG